MLDWLTAAILATAPQGDGAAPTFTVANAGSSPRSEIVRVSIPLHRESWQRGVALVEVRPVDGGDGVVGAVHTLLSWPDGSPSVVQVQARLRLPPHQVRRFTVSPAPKGAEVSGGVFPDGALPLWTELEDPWGRLWRGDLAPDPDAGADGVLWSTPLVRVQRLRGVHRRGVEALLGVRAYLVSFAGERRMELTLLLDNTGLPHGPLGAVRFRRFTLVTGSEELRFRPRHAEENGLSRPLPRVGGGFRQVLLASAPDLYLGDGTAKAWRFDLFLDGEGISDEDRLAARAAARWPLRPLPDLEVTRATGAWSVHGGPAPRFVARGGMASAQLELWRRHARFGPFGGFGDPEDSAAQGTPRNGPSLLHNALRWGQPELLAAAEGMVLQHTLRPTPGARPDQPADTVPWRQGMGRLAQEMPHGFRAADYEHFSVNLLYDWYWLTGDPLARDEMARMGRGLPGLLAAVPFLTCRGEGWCLQGGAMIARATGDRALAAALAHRVATVVEPAMGPPGAAWVLKQPPHTEALGAEDEFDAPWQMAALVHGLHALHGTPGVGTEDRERLARAVLRTARAMAGPCWVDGEGPKYLVSVRDPNRYRMPVGHGTLVGTAWMQTGAFVLASELTGDPGDRELFKSRAEAIAAPLLAPDAAPEVLARVGASPWLQLFLDRGWGGR